MFRIALIGAVAAVVACVPTIPIRRPSAAAGSPERTPGESVPEWTPPVTAPPTPCSTKNESIVDLVIAIDTSHSTRAASGIDVDRDGTTGVNPQYELIPDGQYPRDVLSTDSGDTTLAAETSAVRSLLGRIPFPHFRVSLLTFSGEVDHQTGRQKAPNQSNAHIAVHLTADIDSLEEALRRIEQRGAGGATDFSAAIRVATQELTRCVAPDEINPSLKTVLFLTDGIPTLPFGMGSIPDQADADIAVREAEVARTKGIQIHTFAIGPNALARPEATVAIAERTGGSFTPIAAGDLDTALAAAIGLKP